MATWYFLSSGGPLAMMYTVSFVPMRDQPSVMPCKRPLVSGNMITVDKRTVRIRFVVSYTPVISKDGMLGFSIYGRQIGEDGLKLPNSPLFDITICDVFNGKTIDHITVFFQKFILVDCGLWYQYQDHRGVNDDSVNITKWVSWFEDYSQIIPLNVQYLDGFLQETYNVPKLSNLQSTQEVHTPLPVMQSVVGLPQEERRLVKAPPIQPHDRCDVYPKKQKIETEHTFKDALTNSPAKSSQGITISSSVSIPAGSVGPSFNASVVSEVTLKRFATPPLDEWDSTAGLPFLNTTFGMDVWGKL